MSKGVLFAQDYYAKVGAFFFYYFLPELTPSKSSLDAVVHLPQASRALTLLYICL
jgi:hypothetical protein